MPATLTECTILTQCILAIAVAKDPIKYDTDRIKTMSIVKLYSCGLVQRSCKYLIGLYFNANNFVEIVAKAKEDSEAFLFGLSAVEDLGNLRFS